MVDASQPNLIPPSDLAGILDDAWQLSYLGLLDSWAENGSIFFMLCQGLESRGVIEYEPWKVALTNLERTRVLLATAVAAPSLTSGYNTTSCLDTLTLHINEKVTAPLIQRLGLNFTVGLNESIDTRLLRPQVLLTAGKKSDNSAHQYRHV